MSIVLVSPTEPLLLRQLGTVSPLPESRGADYLIPTAQGFLVGLQRKTISDLVQSLHDGRLHEGLTKMTQLPIRILVIEGRPMWSDTGEMLGTRGRGVSLGGWWGIMCSVQARGIWVLTTGSLDETGVLLSYLPMWFAKPRHAIMDNRHGPVSPWGHASSRDWALHVLQGFEGIGPEVAGAIYDHFGGLPLRWTVTEKDLLQVKGIGKGRARKLLAALELPEQQEAS